MNLLNKLLFSGLLVIISIGMSNGQSNLPDHLISKLNLMDLVISIPTEGAYHKKNISKNDIFRPDYAIRSKKKKAEIHYSFINEQEYPTLTPHVHTTAVITSLATNVQRNALIAVHGVQDELLLSEFNADWGRVIYFQPKRAYTKYQHGKLICLYKSGKGIAYVLFLFNEGGEEEVEQQFRAIRFQE